MVVSVPRVLSPWVEGGASAVTLLVVVVLVVVEVVVVVVVVFSALSPVALLLGAALRPTPAWLRWGGGALFQAAAGRGGALTPGFCVLSPGCVWRVDAPRGVALLG